MLGWMQEEEEDAEVGLKWVQEEEAGVGMKGNIGWRDLVDAWKI